MGEMWSLAGKGKGLEEGPAARAGEWMGGMVSWPTLCGTVKGAEIG